MTPSLNVTQDGSVTVLEAQWSDQPVALVDDAVRAIFSAAARHDALSCLASQSRLHIRTDANAARNAWFSPSSKCMGSYANEHTLLHALPSQPLVDELLSQPAPDSLSTALIGRPQVRFLLDSQNSQWGSMVKGLCRILSARALRFLA